MFKWHRIRTAQRKPGKPGKPGKETFWKKLRENVENIENSLTIFTASGKTQGILFCQTSLIK